MFKIKAEDMNRGYSYIIELFFDSVHMIKIAEEIIKLGFKDTDEIFFSYYVKDTTGKFVQIYSLEEYE